MSITAPNIDLSNKEKNVFTTVEEILLGLRVSKQAYARQGEVYQKQYEKARTAKKEQLKKNNDSSKIQDIEVPDKQILNLQKKVDEYSNPGQLAINELVDPLKKSFAFAKYRFDLAREDNEKFKEIYNNRKNISTDIREPELNEIEEQLLGSAIVLRTSEEQLIEIQEQMKLASQAVRKFKRELKK